MTLDISKPFLLIECKPYASLEETTKAIESYLKELQTNNHFQLWMILPTSYQEPISKQFHAQNLKVGAEMLLSVAPQSFTESIAGKLPKAEGAEFVLVGSQSEQKIESEESFYRQKVIKALSENLLPLICFGESFKDLQEKRSKEILKKQLSPYFAELSPEQIAQCVLLYEAPWLNHVSMEETLEYLQQAYQLTQEILNEQNPELFKSLKWAWRIPAYHPQLPQFINSLPVSGYFFGNLSPSFTLPTPLSALTH